MKPTSEQSEAWGIRSTRDPFARATLSLTALFAGGILVVLLVMNVLMYALFIRNLHVEPDQGRLGLVREEEVISPDDDGIEQELSEEVRERLEATLLIVDVVVLVLALLVGYVLARKTLLPLRLSYERQKQFVSDAAHELRTPLAVMKAGVEVTLERKQESGTYETILKDVLEEVGTLTQLTDDLLLLSREEQAATTVRTELDFSDRVSREVQLMHPYAEKAGVTLSEKIDTQLKIFGDGDSLARVVTNLIKNAIDYTREGGRVEVALSSHAGRAVLVVADTGVGIAEKDIPHLFERFYKADTARVIRRGNGAGLGLSIVRKIVENHSGDIAITSELGKGTRVTVTLPLLKSV